MRTHSQTIIIEDRMAGFKPYIICLCIAFVSALQGTVMDNCSLSQQYCIKLFELGKKVDWHQSTEFCRDNGMEPVAIHNYSIQEEVMTVLNTLPDHHVWLAGQRSSDATWTSVDPDLIFHRNGQDIAGENSDTENCLTGTFNINGSPSYQAVSCSVIQMDNKLICQSNCATPVCKGCDHWYDGRCYHTVRETSKNWYSAQSLCQERYGGDLLHELPVQYSYLGDLTAWLSIGDTVWIGTWRRPWRWNDRTKDDWKNMRYFNWAQGARGMFSINLMLCIVIRSDTGLWQDVPCDQTYQHVLCMGVGAPAAASTASPETTTVYIDHWTSSTIQDTSDGTTDSEGQTTTRTSTGDIKPTTSGLNTHSVKTSGFKLAYIAITVGVLVVVVGVVLAVVFVRRCSMSKSANQEASGSRQPGVTANNYIDMEEVDNTDQVLFSSNYEEVPNNLQVIYSKQNTAEQPPVGETAVYTLATGNVTTGIQHIVTPQGDEYALPNKNSSNVADAYGSAGFDSGEMAAENREGDTPPEKNNSGYVSGAIDPLVTPEGDEYALPSRKMAPTVAVGGNIDDGEDIMVDSAQYGYLI